MNKLYFCRIFFYIDWRHKRLKNTVNLLFFMKNSSMDFQKMRGRIPLFSVNELGEKSVNLTILGKFINKP